MAEIQNRKILSLNEVLNLDRRPTLQEMVDLAVNSIENYTEYLFEKGIIKYLPENLEDYEAIDGEYNSDQDIVLELMNPEFKSWINKNYLNELNENCNGEWTNEDEKELIELEKKCTENPICEEENGIVYINGEEYEYNINVQGVISVYDQYRHTFY
jgi:hypothetical protein